ncbi:MAG: hypothetical protein E7162_06215 [Firmicutes bacterium]|nr:hypothetical protein [Bacillota bacterium]
MLTRGGDMVINLDEIFTNIKDAIILDKDVTFDDDKYHLPEIKELKSVHLDGKIELDESEEVILTGTLSGTMTILDSISLEEVDYNFETELEENLEEIIENDKNSIDIIDILWQNIVLEVPLRYTEVTDYSKYSGDGWRLISEEELKKENNPFQVLIENKKEE